MHIHTSRVLRLRWGRVSHTFTATAAAAYQRGAATPGRGHASDPASAARLISSNASPAPPPGRQVPRFYVPSPLAGTAAGALVRLAAEESRHATRVLRLGPGDAVELCDGLGAVARAELASVDKAGTVVRTTAPPAQAGPPGGWQWELALACGSLKGGRADWVVEKAVELGAAALVPLLTERSPAVGGAAAAAAQPKRRRPAGDGGDGELDGAAAGREGRWHRVAAAAMKQCLRARSMAVSPPRTVAQLCRGLAGADVALVGMAGAAPVHLAVAAIPAGGAPPEGKRGVLIIGPEGDFTAAELQQLVAAGAVPVGLGPLRLRAETAAVGLLAYVTLALPLSDAADAGGLER